MHKLRLLLSAAAVLACGVSAAATPAGQPGFDLFEFAVEGNTVLADIDIEKAVYPSLGPGRTPADVEQARAALEAAYHQNGYLSVSVTVPVQGVADGVVRLQVIEGQVERLKVSGNQYTSRQDLRGEVPELAPGKVPHFPTMQAELAQAGRSPDRRVTPLLRPGTRLGTMEVELAVEDGLPLHGNIELNNRQSPDTSSTRLEAGIRYENLFQKQHSAGLNYVLSPESLDEVNVLAGFYNAPLGNGRSLSAFAQHSNSNIGSAVGSTVLGKGTTLGARYSLTLPQAAGVGGFFHSLSVGMDYKDLQENQNVLGADTKKAPLRYTPFVAQYSAGHFGEKGSLAANLTLVANIDTGSREVDCQGVKTDQFACRRYGARPGFAALRGDLSYTRRLSGWEAFAKLDFQASGQALVSPEQFLGGGMDTVRAYLEGEAAGDAGWRLRTEVRSPTLAEWGGSGLRAIGFVEGASLWLHDPLPGQKGNFTLAGAGVGLRLKGERGGPLFVLDLAQALTDGPRTASGKHRVHVRLGYEF